MKHFKGVVFLFLGVILGAVVCDQKCDDIIKTVAEKYADKVNSTDLLVCSEKTPILCAEDYAPALLEKKPTVFFDVKNSCKYATISFFGKSPDSDIVTLLWLVYDVEADTLKNGFTGQSGNERVIYTKPKTAEGTSNHFFFVYCQDNAFNTFECCSFEDRKDFKPKEFAKKNKLKEVVTAGLYFKVTATGEVMKSDITEKENVCKTK